MPEYIQQPIRPRLDAHLLGPHPVVHHFLERMGLRGILRDALESGIHRGLDHAETLSLLVHNVLTSRGALYWVPEWASSIEPSALRLTPGQLPRLNDDRLARSLDALVSARGRTVFFRLAVGVVEDFELDCSRVHFDTTTVTLFGQYKASKTEPEITYGHSKAHRPDLKQLRFGLNVTADGAVPLLHSVHSGNRTDNSVHVQNVDRLRELLGREDFTYVADSKLCTKANLEHVAAYGGHFVTVMPRTRKEYWDFRESLRVGTVKAGWRPVLAGPSRWAEDGPDVYASTSKGPATTEEGWRIVWFRSSQKARLDAESREGRTRRAQTEIALLTPKLGKRELRTAKGVGERTDAILAHYGVADFLRVDVSFRVVTEERDLRRSRPKPGDPKKTIRSTKFGVPSRETRRRSPPRRASTACSLS